MSGSRLRAFLRHISTLSGGMPCRSLNFIGPIPPLPAAVVIVRASFASRTLLRNFGIVKRSGERSWPFRELFMVNAVRARASAFCDRFGLRLPILEAPMAGACPVARAIAVTNAGGMGAFGAMLSEPDAIAE